MSPTSCPIRQHTADGVNVGMCWHAIDAGVCPLHGRLADYPNLDDREVDPQARNFTPEED